MPKILTKGPTFAVRIRGQHGGNACLARLAMGMHGWLWDYVAGMGEVCGWHGLLWECVASMVCYWNAWLALGIRGLLWECVAGREGIS